MFSNSFISKVKLLKKPFNLNKIDDELLNLIEKEKLRLPHLAFENITNLQRYGVSNLFASKHSQKHSKKTRLENSWKIANSFKNAIPMFTKEEFTDLRKTYLWKCAFCWKYF